MLISQKIASSNSFLKTLSDELPVGFKKELVRADVLKSVKFLIGSHLFNLSNPVKAILEKMEPPKAKDSIRKTYARLPFACLCIENETGLVLLKQVGDRVLSRWVDKNGLILPFSTISEIEDLTDSKGLSFADGDKFKSVLNNFNVDKETFAYLTGVFHRLTLDMLVYLNTTNINPVHYKPSRRELGKIPQVFKPFFEYRVVDIYRERKSFKSLEDVEGFINDPKGSAERRAHLVRGHFKNKNGKLFWWNSFMRNRNNLHTDGLIVHDYQVH